MTSRQIQQWAQSPGLLNDETLLQLEFLVQRYPLFQTVRFLYLKNLKKLDAPQFGAAFKAAAFFISDKEALYHYLEQTPDHVIVAEEPAPPVAKGKTAQSIDAFLQTAELNSIAPANELTKKALAAHDYASYFLSDLPDVEEATEERSSNMKHYDMVDRYIEQSDKPRMFRPFAPAEEVETLDSEHNVPDQKGLVQDSFFTESLAKIYIQQKKYGKALHIIKGLSLKYPEKSVYFADQIRFLEILVNNIKQ